MSFHDTEDIKPNEIYIKLEPLREESFSFEETYISTENGIKQECLTSDNIPMQIKQENVEDSSDNQLHTMQNIPRNIPMGISLLNKYSVCPTVGCGTQFKCLPLLRKHISDCHADFENEHEIKYHYDGNNNTCDQCKISFSSQSGLIKHKTKSPKYKCECGLQICTHRGYWKHKRHDCNVKNTPNSLICIFKCPHKNCGTLYKHKKSLKAHIKKYHKDEELFLHYF